MLRKYIVKVVEGNDLSEQEAFESITAIISGNSSQVQVGGFLAALTQKGFSSEEIKGAARAFSKQAIKVSPNTPKLLDTCGTGGHTSSVFNISTTTCFVLAGCGVSVAKNGNRSFNSSSGSADLIEALGIELEQNPEILAKTIDNVGIAFMFAPYFHPSLRHAELPRKELGIRTIFNVLLPLSNPASAKYQVLGVYCKNLVSTVAKVLMDAGVERALVVHGADGLDELSNTGVNYVSELNNNQIKEYELLPSDFGFKTSSLDKILGGEPQLNARIALDILNNRLKDTPYEDIVLMNSAAGLYVYGLVNNFNDGVLMAKDAIRSGNALSKLEALRLYTKNHGNS